MVKELRPLHVSIIGGEPLVRYREVSEILKRLEALGVRAQLVTSAVRPIPPEWAMLKNLQLVVSIDGLQPEHDRRRTPATYARIQEHISGQKITVHCTITRQFAQRDGYLEEFSRFWSAKEEVKRIWFSSYTPQDGEISDERLRPEDRTAVVREVRRLRNRYPKVHATDQMLDAFAKPPQSPEECIFARTTDCYAADLTTKVTPCQLGGKPVCAECGCLASVGMAAVGRHRLAGLVTLESLFAASFRIGENVRKRRMEKAAARTEGRGSQAGGPEALEGEV